MKKRGREGGGGEEERERGKEGRGNEKGQEEGGRRSSTVFYAEMHVWV